MLTKPCPDCLNGKAMERWGWRCFECHTKVRDTQLARNRHNTNGEQGGGAAVAFGSAAAAVEPEGEQVNHDEVRAELAGWLDRIVFEFPVMLANTRHRDAAKDRGTWFYLGEHAEEIQVAAVDRLVSLGCYERQDGADNKAPSRWRPRRGTAFAHRVESWGNEQEHGDG
jgi:hypothetical protein